MGSLETTKVSPEPFKRCASCEERAHTGNGEGCCRADSESGVVDSEGRGRLILC